MGAEFEAQAYIPGSFDMTDSSVNSNGNMSPFYEEKKAKLHESHKFTILSENGSVHYDKEMIKRTMLVHDATFRKQVYELHHLYKIQKELMAQLEGEEFGVYPRYADTLKSQAHSPGDVKAEWQDGTPISGHDLKQSSIDFINETSSQYSVNGASRRYSNNSSAKKMLDLELPADVCANDKDVKIMDVNPLKCLSWPDGSVRDVSDRIKLGNSESKHVKSWTTGTQPRHNSAVHIFNKPVEGPSNMKITDSISVGASTQKQPYLLWNLKNLALQGNWREKPAGEAYGSSFFGANEEIRHTNSSRQRMDDPNTSRAWLQHNQNSRNSSFGQYLSSNGAFNHFIPAPPLFSDANSPWQSSNMSHYGFSMDSTNTPCRRQLKMHGKPQYQKPPTHKNIVKDLDLNDVPADTSATWQEGRETSTAGTPTFSEKAIGLMKSQVPPSCANGLPQTCVSSMSYSDNGIATRIPSIPIGTPAERDSQFSPSPERHINIAAPIKSEADKEMHPQSKSADSSIRNLFDLNETLPISDDDLEVDPCEPEGGIAPHEPNNDPSRDTLAVTAAENLVAMGNDSTHPGSPKLDTLHWFADLATFKENDDSGDDFEALTLKLEETKSHELVVLPAPTTLEDDSNNDGHCSPASLLVAARPRRGKARGRPAKKRDFQRDVLPSLPSLPEQQVSEDLCLLGRAKLATPSKRGGRNGQQQQQPRGRRRTRSVAAVVVEEEAEVSPQSAPPPLPPAPADSGADAPLMTRWGRTTRRCRRPRCPPVNNASLHVA